MKTLIVYASKTGTAKQCAEALTSRLPEAVLCDITAETPDPAGYDYVVLGGGVRMGLLNNNLRLFAENNKNVLAGKKLGLFITCGYEELAEKTIANNYPAELVSAAKVKMSFGGEMDPAKQKGFMDKMVCKMQIREFRKNGIDMPRLYPKRYSKFATELTAE